MKNRKQFRKIMILVKVLGRNFKVNEDQKNKLQETDKMLRRQLSDVKPDKIEEIKRRRKALFQNIDLREIFDMFWITLNPYISDGILSKEGYLKCNKQIQLALTGELDPESADEAAEADYIHDTQAFGPLNKVAFCDMLHELVETWIEMIDSKYEAPFAWGLLDACIDFTIIPPKFRPPRNVQCFIRVNNEAEILTKFSKEKAIRAQLHLNVKWLKNTDLNSETQSRLISRKHGEMIDSGTSDGLQLLNRHIVRAEFSFDSTEDPDILNAIDSEPIISDGKIPVGNSASTRLSSVEIPVQNGKLPHHLENARATRGTSVYEHHEFSDDITLPLTKKGDQGDIDVVTRENENATVRRKESHNNSGSKNSHLNTSRDRNSVQRIPFPVSIANVPGDSNFRVKTDAVSQPDVLRIVQHDTTVEKFDVKGDYMKVFFQDGFLLPDAEYLNQSEDDFGIAGMAMLGDGSIDSNLLLKGNSFRFDSKDVSSSRDNYYASEFTGNLSGTEEFQNKSDNKTMNNAQDFKNRSYDGATTNDIGNSGYRVGESGVVELRSTGNEKFQNKSDNKTMNNAQDFKNRSYDGATTNDIGNSGYRVGESGVVELHSNALKLSNVDKHVCNSNDTNFSNKSDINATVDSSSSTRFYKSNNIHSIEGFETGLLNDDVPESERTQNTYSIDELHGDTNNASLIEAKSKLEISQLLEVDQLDLDTWLENAKIIAKSCLTNGDDSSSIGSLPPPVKGTEGDRFDDWIFYDGQWIHAKKNYKGAKQNTQPVDQMLVHFSESMLDSINWGRQLIESPTTVGETLKIRGLNSYWLGPLTSDPRSQIGWKFARAKKRLELVKLLINSTNGAIFSKCGVSDDFKRGRVPPIYGTSAPARDVISRFVSTENRNSWSAKKPFTSPLRVSGGSSKLNKSTNDLPKQFQNTFFTMLDENAKDTSHLPEMSDEISISKNLDAANIISTTLVSEDGEELQYTEKINVIDSDSVFISAKHEFPSSTRNSKNSNDVGASIIENGLKQISRKRGVVPVASSLDVLLNSELAILDAELLNIKPLSSPVRSPPKTLSFEINYENIRKTKYEDHQNAGSADIRFKPKSHSQALVRNLKKKMISNSILDRDTELQFNKKLTTKQNVLPSGEAIIQSYSPVLVSTATGVPVPFMPWVPANSLQPQESDKSDLLFGWEDKKLFKSMRQYDTSRDRSIIKRQNIIRHSFETFMEPIVTSSFAKQNMLKNHKKFMSSIQATNQNIQTASLTAMTDTTPKSSLDLGSKVYKL